MAKKSMAQKLREVDAENRRLIEYLSGIRHIVLHDLKTNPEDKPTEILKIIIKWESEG